MAEALVRFIVSGRVQMVGYRWFAVRAAERNHILGYARNLASGAVEVVAQGTPCDIELFAALLKQGPHSARVDRIDRTPLLESEQSFDSFTIR